MTQDVLIHPENTYSTQTVTFDIKPTVCNKVRLVATKLGTVDTDTQFMLQIGEFRAFGSKCTNVAKGSSVEMNVPSWATGFPAKETVDGIILENDNFATGNAKTGQQSFDEIVTLTLKETSRIDSIVLYPAVSDGKSSGGYPVDFTISIYDGTKFVEVKKVTGESLNAVGTAVSQLEGTRYRFDTVETTKVQIKVTKHSEIDSEGSNKYALRLGEIMALGDMLGDLTTRTKKTDEKTTLLTLKDKQLTNFKAEIEMVYFNSATTSYGLYLGQSEPGVTSGATKIQPYVWADYAAGGLRVEGVDVNSATYVKDNLIEDGYLEDAYNTAKYGMINQIDTNGTGVMNKMAIKGFPKVYDDSNIQTLNVEVLDGVAKLWWTGFENAAWTVNLKDYEGGYISLFSTGADVGGFVSFTFYEIMDRAITTNANMNVEVLGDYTIVSVTNDIAKGLLKNSTFQGTVKYDADKYEYCTTIITDSKADVHKNVDEIAFNGSVTVNFQSYNIDAVAKLYFKNKVGTIDYSGFAITDSEVIRANQNKTKASNTATLDIAYDYSGAERNPDKCVDVRDLVRATKDNKNPEDVRNAMVGTGSDWVYGIVGQDSDAVYVNATTGTVTGAGTEDSPLSSLLLATYRVKDNGTIYVDGSYVFAEEEKTIGVDGKTITITGKDSGANLDMTGISSLDVNGDIIIDEINMKVGANTLVIYADGHDFTINSNVKFDGYVKEIYAGNKGEMPLDSTNITLNGGNYNRIYGGSAQDSFITGDTHVIVGGTLNQEHPNFSLSDHAYYSSVAIFGGSQNGTVKGGTHVTVQTGAELGAVYGGGYGANSVVEKTCNVTIEGGKMMGCYGGSFEGKVSATNVNMTSGEVEDIFGGCYGIGMTGETNVTVTGGKVTRRIFGGCYNESRQETYHVSGNTSVNIGGNADFTHDYTGDIGFAVYDYVICGGSRYWTDHDVENSVINITTDRNNQFGTYIDNDNAGSTETKNVVDTLPQ